MPEGQKSEYSETSDVLKLASALSGALSGFVGGLFQSVFSGCGLHRSVFCRSTNSSAESDSTVESDPSEGSCAIASESKVKRSFIYPNTVDNIA